MEPQTNDFPHYGYKPTRSNSFMILSFCMGVLAIATCSFLFAAMVFGGLAMIFAILSKGNDKQMQRMPRAGIITGCIGIVISIVITANAVYLIFTNDEYRQQLNETSKQLYGISIDEMLQEMEDQYEIK